MTDPRETPSNGRVAHVSLKGVVTAETYSEGKARQATGIADICSAPRGGRERQLLPGEVFTVLEERSGWAFGFAGRDGYVGYVETRALGPARPVSHRVRAARSYAKPTADLKATEPVVPLSFGSRVEVTGASGAWSRVLLDGGAGYVPGAHLAKADSPENDPAAVAELFLGTPYLWGGNSAFGIDCSGLVQAALLACGIPCPGDSDQQQDRVGRPVAEGDTPERGDLYFWKGHVGLLTDPATLIHANAHAMAVVHEPLDAAIARIREQGGGEVTAVRRVSRRDG